MCARKMMFSDVQKIKQDFQVKQGSNPNFPPRWNVAITDRQPIVRLNTNGKRQLDMATWDYRDEKVKSLKKRPPFYNARGESMSGSEAFAQRRCLVPCDGFYEWAIVDGKKQPFAFRRADGEPFAMGGVWSEWRDPETSESLLTYVELTVEPGALVRPIHGRAPLIIDRHDWAQYLEGTLSEARKLVRPSDMPEFVCYPVSPEVNSVKNEGAHLTTPYQCEPRQPTLI